MIIILHGEDIVASRKKIDEFIKEDLSTVKIDASKSNLTEIINAIESQELFFTGKLVIFENLFSLPSSILEKAIDAINKNSNTESLNIILWEGKKLEDKNIKKIIKPKVFLFDLPKYYFEFLDSIEPKKGKVLKKLLDNLSKQSTEEQIFYSLVKRIRVLMIVKTGKYQDFEETKKMSPWQIGKLSKQAQNWNEEELIAFYKKLFELELGIKTSQLSMNLLNHLDILLLSI